MNLLKYFVEMWNMLMSHLNNSPIRLSEEVPVSLF